MLDSKLEREEVIVMRLGNWQAVLFMSLACWGLVAVAAWRAPACARWLSGSDPAVRSDLLVALAGGAEERLIGAATLYREGLAPVLLVTEDGPRGTPRLVEMGVPTDRVIRCAAHVSSTREDALCVREFVQRNGYGSVLVVTSPYHCRRARLIMGRTLAGTGARVNVVGSKSLYWRPEAWWSENSGWEIPAELVKLVWAWASVPIGMNVPPVTPSRGQKS